MSSHLRIGACTLIAAGALALPAAAGAADIQTPSLKASATLAALIASPDVPYESKQGLKTAYDAVTAEHGSVADILSHLSDRMPQFVRTLVEGIITQARTDAQGVRDNHPTGPPAGTPGDPPAGTPAGPPTRCQTLYLGVILGSRRVVPAADGRCGRRARWRSRSRRGCPRVVP